jgi:hypothetical protein
MASEDMGWAVCEVCESGTTDSVVIDTGEDLAIACRSCWWDYIDVEFIDGDLDAEREYLQGRGF